LWDKINLITGNKQKTNLDEQLCKAFEGVSAKKIATNFNQYFSDLVPKLQRKYYKRKMIYINSIRYGTLSRKLGSKKLIQSSIFIEEPSDEEIMGIINNMKISFATGIDGFRLDHIQNSILNSTKFLKILINSIIKHEIWPDKLKTQVLRPIYKKGPKNSCENYRPISLLPVIDKLIEKFFANKIVNFLTKHNILTETQFGFRKNSSTTEALKKLNDIVTEALNHGKFIGVVLIDLQKAFDTIDLNKLILKCQQYGIRGKMLNILKTYLINRKAGTKVNGELSDLVNIKYGVPQGSVLGPLLFLIYINDVEDVVHNSSILLFADDIILLSINSVYNIMITNLQEDFDRINTWFAINEVFISESKTINLTIKSYKGTISSHESIFLHSENCTFLNGADRLNCVNTCTAITRQDNAEYLGTIIDSNWSFKQHIERLILRLRQQMPKLYQVRDYIDFKTKKLIYDAWIESHLRYGLEIYGFANTSLIHRLQKTQNRIVKILFTNYKKSEDIYKKLNILKITQLRNYVIILKNFFDYKIYKVYPSNLRFGKFQIPLWRNEYGKRNSCFYLPSIFNTLSDSLLRINNYNELKKILKPMLINSSI
jgi:hypothetical protein